MKRFAAMAIALLTLPLAAQTPEEKSSVQYLKGLTPLQMQRTMNFIRASLGVHCDYCHVNTEEAGWDWKSDAKPEKLAAREMIAMTIETNTKFFKGHTDVTCNTCHRGATRPVGLPVLPQAQPPFPTPKSERPKLPSRDEVVNKYAAALGNVDAAALKNLTLKGTRESADGKTTVPIDIVVSGDTVRVESGERVQVMSPSGSWVKDDKPARTMPPGQVENFAQLSDAYRFIHPSEIPADARVVRQDKIGDREVLIVQNAIDPKTRQRLYFDAQNGLLLRRVTYMNTPIGDVGMQTDFSDYRDAGNGVKLPFVVRVDSVDPWIGATRKYSEIKVGAKADPNVFMMPK